MSVKRRYSDLDQRNTSCNSDVPPYSRLFIVCSKAVTENTLRDEFGKFGTIEELWFVKDRQTGERKGVVYIKFSKTSEAAKALEEMNGKHVEGGDRPIKVLIAHSRGEGSKKDPLEEERLLRLFVVCKKTSTAEDLESHFEEFGDIDNIKLVKNRDTNENKGFAYIKYYKMSHAALAYENCDRSYKPKFAEPKPTPQKFKNGLESYDRFENPGFNSGPSSSYDNFSMSLGMPSNVTNFVNNFQTKGKPFTKLQVLVAPTVTQEQLWGIFDIAPGMEYCRVFPDFRSKAERLLATVTYSTPQQAAYARDKIHGLEYPPGHHMIVRPDFSENTQQMQQLPSSLSMNTFSGLNPGSQNLSKADIELLAENVKQATAILKAHTGISGISPASYDPHYCTAKLPPVRQFEDDEEPAGQEARLFVVFNPSIPERCAIEDVFGRFGKITDIFLLVGKNVGYVSYSRKESIKDAIAALHGQELCGMYMKVMEAEPRRSAGNLDEDRRKRQKVQQDE
ncbi:UNVERIFIED_CONTAM: hypothetical protein PYX00_001768 [Menopon gallinae]|uniref:RRM domain-containing protein n=1 Tax=Menopon gallinae TaxID=328185 RepID=A0AAW2IFB9_9NEOP